MIDKFCRTSMLLGDEAMSILKNSHVAVFGVGGVGSYTIEALARCAIGELTIIDNDIVSQSNINRQLIATTDTVGMYKTQVMKSRILSINPDCRVNALNMFYTPDSSLDLSEFDFIADAIDTVSSKIDLAVKAESMGIKSISCMGAGNKIDPTLFQVSDIYKTTVCPLARVMRKELKLRNVKHLKVVFSTEQPVVPGKSSEITNKRQTPGSVSFVPSVAGLIMAGEIIKELVER